MPTRIEPLGRFGTRSRCLEAALASEHFCHLARHREHRIQGRHWFLEDHRDTGAAQFSEPRLVELMQFLTVKTQTPRRYAAGRRRYEAEQRERRHALAAAGFADETDDLAGEGGFRTAPGSCQSGWALLPRGSASNRSEALCANILARL